LLLPFMLLNFAFYMTPRPPTQDDGSVLRKLSAAIQRLSALTLTASLVLSAAGVAMDLVGWQCGRAGSGCASRHGWLGFLGWSGLDSPSRQLAVTSLLPAAVVALLWYLGRATWSAHELVQPPGRKAPLEGAPADAAPETVLLEDRRTWNGGTAVGRLRAAHVVVGFSVVSALLLAPLARHGGWARTLLAVHQAVIAVLALTLAVWSGLAQRDRPPEQPRDPEGDVASAALSAEERAAKAEARAQAEAEAEAKLARARREAHLIDWLALAVGLGLYLVTVALAIITQPDPGARSAGPLPWFTGR